MNRQIKDEVISRTVPYGCVTKVYAITVDAVDFSLNKADVDGYKVSGDIALGDSQARLNDVCPHAYRLRPWPFELRS
ncbi:MAG TPA: hypothetical protein VIJ62_06150 [Rhizomicrobium sp.]